MTEQMQQLSKGELLEQQVGESRRTFAAWAVGYEEQHPKPEMPPRLDFRGLGFEFYLYLVQAMFSIGLAALRTSDAFYFIGYAVAGNVVYASAESILSVVVVELGMVVFAAILAQKRYREAEAKRREKAEIEGTRFRRSKEVDVSKLVIGVGLFLMALISMAAGLHQSIRIIDNIDPTFVKYLSYGLGVVIGVGVTIIAVIGGDILGQQLAIITAAYKDRESEYQDALDDYQEAMLDAWKMSPEYRVVSADVRAAARVRGDASSLSGSISGTHGTFQQAAGFGNGRRPPVQTERVYNYMDQILRTENRVASFAEVQQTLEIPKSTASRLRNEWLADRGVSED